MQFAPGSNFGFRHYNRSFTVVFLCKNCINIWNYTWKYQVFRVFLYITCTRDIFVGTCIIFVAIFIDFRGCSFMRKSLLFMLSSKYLTGATVRKPCTNCHNSWEILFLISFPKMMLLGNEIISLSVHRSRKYHLHYFTCTDKNGEQWKWKVCYLSSLFCLLFENQTWILTKSTLIFKSTMYPLPQKR